MGKIVLEGMQFRAYHGVHDFEKEKGNDFIVDVYIETNIHAGAQTDEILDTLDYVSVYEIVKNEMGNRSHLLEHLAKRIYSSINSSFNQIESLNIRVSKLTPPVGGPVERVYIEYGGS